MHFFKMQYLFRKKIAKQAKNPFLISRMLFYTEFFIYADPFINGKRRERRICRSRKKCFPVDYAGGGYPLLQPHLVVEPHPPVALSLIVRPAGVNSSTGKLIARKRLQGSLSLALTHSLSGTE